MNKFDDIQAMLGLTEKEKAQVLSMNMNNDPARIYKEVWIGLGAYNPAVYATEVSLEEYLAYTTEETEKWKSCSWLQNSTQCGISYQAYCYAKTENANNY